MTLFGVVLWATFDLRFEPMVQPLASTKNAPLKTLHDVVLNGGVLRGVVLGVVSVIASVSLALLLASVFCSKYSARERSIASLLAIMFVVAVWLSIARSRSSLAWQGKRVRIAVQVPELETLTQTLRHQWPERDGNLPGIGPFMAYPFGRPTTLMLLQSPPVSGATLCISAIERHPDGAILLQLSGSNHDDWAEWHPIGSQPVSFVGGLSDPHQLQSCASIGGGWYLARYDAVKKGRVPSDARVASERRVSLVD